jgi:hypothetical protein
MMSSPANCLVVSVLMVVLSSQAASAQSATVGSYVTGHSITESCRLFLKMRQDGRILAKDGFDAGECYGYVVAILDRAHADAASGVQAAFCANDSVNANDAVEVVARYLDLHPERRIYGAYFLVRDALAAGYPC